MNTELFTYEEECLMSIFEAGGRKTLINNIQKAMPHFDDPEMAELAQNTLRKLKKLTEPEVQPIYDEQTAIL